MANSPHTLSHIFHRHRFHPGFTPVFGLIALLAIVCSLLNAAPSTTTSIDETAPAEAGFQNLLDSVVRLDVWAIIFRGGREETTQGVGSGVIMTPEGHILTNAHVVNPDAERIWITLSNLERVPATLIGWDHWTDLAVVQLDVDALETQGMTFSWGHLGDSDKLKPGETVYAVGTPNGLARTVTRGIISNTNRFFEGTQVGRGYETGYFNTWLQTDAAINPGNSGGPLALPNGAVIGINTRAYLGANNLGFAVPSNSAKAVMQELIEKGSIKRSYTGIVPGPMQDLEAFFDLEINQGMLVQSIDPGSPAQKAGLQPSDIILTIDNESIDGRFPEQLPSIQKHIAERPVGSDIIMSIKRNNERLPITITTELLQSRVGEETALKAWGMSVQKVSKAVARERQLNSSNGVSVIGTQPAFPAFEAGIRPGDIITVINQTPIVTLEDFKTAYTAYVAKPEPVLMEISRNYQVSLVLMKP